MQKLRSGLLFGGVMAILITSGTDTLASRDTGPSNTADPAIDSDARPVTAATTQPATEPSEDGIDQIAFEGVPLPEPANVPPPSIRDIGHPLLANLAAADLPIAERLRELVTTKQMERVVNRKREREAVATFYAARGFVPLWIDNGTANTRAKAAIERLTAAALEGLDPDDYPTPEFKAGSEASALADAELVLTSSVLNYARHAHAGRVHYSRVTSEISYGLAVPEPLDILTTLAETKDVDATLRSYSPRHAGYAALRAKLAALRKTAGRREFVRIPDGPTMHLGMDDARVPLLRKRLDIPGDERSTIYDKAVFEAVKKFQADAGTVVDGSVGPQTLRAMNGAHRGREIEIIIANMERWRWMPRELGNAYSILNVPDFSLKVVRDGATVWATKVVVGKVSTPTPLFSDTMKFITVNPTWNVPPSIINNEYLPALQQDPTVLDRVGIKVVYNRDGSVRMYQPPGDGNALGRLRFNFPNKYLVYQHDTPDKYLFDKTVRAYSNGCMRIQDPLKYAEILLSIAMPDEGYTQERLRKMIGAPERNINFARNVPVHLTYQTAFVDDAGRLVIRDDIYGYDKRITELLRGESRRIADIAVPAVHRHADNSETHRISSRAHSGEGSFTAPSLFDLIFR